MAIEPYVAEITVYAFSYPPKGWAACNGQILPINQNQALFALLGTTYGGNGQTTFALPDLRGKIPLHGSATYTLGSTGGETTHTLLASELPAHTHTLNGSSANGTQVNPAGNLPAIEGGEVAPLYGTSHDGQSMRADLLQPSGGAQPHNNMPPTLGLNFCIALQGIFPSRN